MKMSDNETVFYTAKELAQLLDVSVKSLSRNRKSNNPIPCTRTSYRVVCYEKEAVLAWIGRKDLPLKFYSSRHLAEKLGVSIDWLDDNRRSSNPIPFRRILGLIRYNEGELLQWLKKNRIHKNQESTND